MTPMPTPESLVDAFTSTQRKPSNGAVCQTCAHPRIEEINRALIAFAEKKEAGETTHAWSDFHEHVLVPNFNYNLSKWSMRRHVTRCLNHA